MKLFLLRHAIAEDTSFSGKDQDRALTPTGYERLDQVLRVASHAGVEPELIISSPYVRARQTAEKAALRLRCDEPIVFSDALVPHSSPTEAWSDIRTIASAASASRVLVVSHDPLISTLLSFLLDTTACIHSFKKAGMVRIDLFRTGARPAGEIHWILTPALASAAEHHSD
jgi:phosphohistidine phosphatase